ncbi:RNA polymerase, sigma subunit, ECF family [Octadecabacter temperatus]|uniref:ECF RNA polymerase sigma factor SigW n=1 Tax=Octadecabacter temperatus TaxID=1458307 RepID=A0A0K0Y6Y7_9RHOB|nr:sigma-70 family RNA polymerase sigma factor [Octadecabacter temperatus]AKS46714.1 ECF RNA polymerase sigma factor SigW [Octadecabacter temperatus]SIO19823.1 RNA polymerase, sigma subunit, ECF family [Octadecabacter temperatus]
MGENQRNTTSSHNLPDASDKEAVAGFVRENIQWMMQVALHYLRDIPLAEDAVQIAFSKIFTKSDQFKGQVRIQAWMRSIVVNEALMILRKRKSLKEDNTIDPLLPEFDKWKCRVEMPWVNVPNPEDLLITEQTRQTVRAAIDKLSDAYRVVLLLRDIEEQTTAEVAEALEISEANVKVRLHRARAALKTLLEPQMREGRFN